MNEQIFRWNSQIPIRFMRLEVGGRLYAYKSHKNDEMILAAVQKGGYRGSAHMLKAFLVKHRWSQDRAATELHVSQAAIAKYVRGERTMPLRIALEIESLNTEVSFDMSWQSEHKTEKIFKLEAGIHIAYMRIEAFGKFYAYSYRKDAQMFFVAVPKREYQAGKLLKDFRKKYNLTQAESANALKVSKSTIVKYETGERILKGPQLEAVQIMTRFSLEEAKQWREYQLHRIKTVLSTMPEPVRIRILQAYPDLLKKVV